MRLYFNSKKYAHPYWVRLTENELRMLVHADKGLLLKLESLIEKVKDSGN